MSRSGYSDDCDNRGLWRAAVSRAIYGKRGQAFLREMAAALDAMPIKELVADAIVRDEGHVCAIGSVAVARQIDVSQLDVYDGEEVAKTFGVARALVCEISYENDNGGERYVDGSRKSETPAERWTRMRVWVTRNIAAPKLPPSSGEG